MPASAPPPLTPRRLAAALTALCVLALIAAVVSFVNGNLLGVVWVLLAGLCSNMAWYHWRRARLEEDPTERSGRPG
ncbi:hypothetical protein [Streptomyces sp. NPDC005438]|uniref:hypothetical protein n=1 Tax=Streptomyces sp. NPDC005438 TaxID=3156880 RepID=UPI0033AA7DDD